MGSECLHIWNGSMVGRPLSFSSGSTMARIGVTRSIALLWSLFDNSVDDPHSQIRFITHVMPMVGFMSDVSEASTRTPKNSLNICTFFSSSGLSTSINIAYL
ncbi:hypothetical protein AYI69_g3669 [Smittium culicis]|uniref:Uncharacterized protein n=1 Tax=Smittium culicis TaxID=133412 RepID=A0A1R1YJE1_9FUNG|nr:hypothetical protein AYI69_g3669 [Smittium culicis]